MLSAIKRLIALRRLSQTVFISLFIYILWSTTYPLKGALPPETFFRINPLITIFTSISERIMIPGVFLSIIMLALTAVFGRFFCGWVCPLGTVMDVCSSIKKAKFRERDAANSKLRAVKFFILGVIAAASFVGLQIAWVFDPMGIMARFVSMNLIPIATSLMNTIFKILIRGFGLYGPLHDLYRSLKFSVLGVEVHFFSHSVSIFLFFAFICAMVIVVRRFWCRTLCPLGAIYSITARLAPLKLTVDDCEKCHVCKKECRMGAIKENLSYLQGECILCMDCIYNCPRKSMRFSWRKKDKKEVNSGPGGGDAGGGISRRQFITLLFSSAFLLGFKKNIIGIRRPRNVIRPPAALGERDFTDRCIRCGNCMKVCITNGLQPVMLQEGLGGIWTPHLVPEIGYCEYNCTLCGNVCPTGAIRRITAEEKKITRLGLAKIDQSLCVPWAQDKHCIVCQEHCPVSEKAIKLKKKIVGDETILMPYIDEVLCVGCGICQNKCPVRPVRAIRVSPV
ncbi:4Fe-4S binding protein [Candidatus Omnitrophota bacterium]